MKFILLISFLLLSLFSISQNSNISDSTLSVVCKTLLTSDNKLLSDSDRIKQALVKHITPIISNLSKTEQSDALTYVFFRLQRNCKEFKDILERAEPNKGDWVRVSQKPNSTLTKKEFDIFMKIGNYYYFEASGDTVHLKLTSSTWQDNFKDGSYSRLRLNWLKDAEFQIEFIESNNLVRKNFSKPGDKYNYQLLEKDEKKYKLSVEIPNTDQFFTFFLYIEQ